MSQTATATSKSESTGLIPHNTQSFVPHAIWRIYVVEKYVAELRCSEPNSPWKRYFSRAPLGYFKNLRWSLYWNSETVTPLLQETTENLVDTIETWEKREMRVWRVLARGNRVVSWKLGNSSHRYLLCELRFIAVDELKGASFNEEAHMIHRSRMFRCVKLLRFAAWGWTTLV